MFKNLTIGKRISILISCLLVVGLVILATAVSVKLRQDMKQTSNDRFEELAMQGQMSSKPSLTA